jgi:leucyl/phenylalanyl-tRNA--protein transferase
VIFDLDGTPADIGFPDVNLAETDPNGLLAIGGDLSQTRLLTAYRNGIFPWYSAGQPILWWSPAPRMVLFPTEFHVSRSLRRTLRRSGFELSVDTAFEAVIRACAGPRARQDGTWLLGEMIEAYLALHHAGHAHSFEVWLGDQLIGGLYGLAIGQAFFGESMFSRRADASKAALALLVDLAATRPFQLIDCQVYTDHLASLGAREIARDEFHRLLAGAVDAPAQALSRLARRPAADLPCAG